MALDPELEAMNSIHSTLTALEDEQAQQRVLSWVSERLGLKLQQAKIGSAAKAGKGAQSSENGSSDLSLGSFSRIPDLFAAANTKTGRDKVLLVAGYLQQTTGNPDLTGREINRELTNLGHGVQNITTSIAGLINRKPNLMIQTRKDGKSQQAQKRYRVTVEGFKVIGGMLGAIEEAEE